MSDALAAAGLQVTVFSARELSNFTHSLSLSSARAALAVFAASSLIDSADTGMFGCSIFFLLSF
jgi:histidine ammonia-lyase